MISRSTARRGTRELSNATNPLLKLFRHALAEGVTRQGWLAVEGPILLEEALAAGSRARVHSVLVAQGAEGRFRELLARLPPDTEVARVPDRLFVRTAATETPQGVAALVELDHDDLNEVLARPDAILLVACGLQDPGNLGTMIRSAQALGAAATVTLEETVSPFNPKAVRASAGAIFRHPTFTNQNAHSFIGGLRRTGVRVIAADAHSLTPIDRADLRGQLAFLVGREASGLPQEILLAADQRLSIPIRPRVDSLNAATAAAVFLYEAARQRRFQYRT